MTPATRLLWERIVRHLFGIVRALESWVQAESADKSER